MIVILIDLNLQDISARRYSKLYRTEGGMGRRKKTLNMVCLNLQYAKDVFLLVGMPTKIITYLFYANLSIWVICKIFLRDRNKDEQFISNQRWEFIKENKKVRKQENKKTRKQELDGRFLGGVLVFFLVSLLSWSSSCFLTFLFYFINTHLWKTPSNSPVLPLVGRSFCHNFLKD